MNRDDLPIDDLPIGAHLTTPRRGYIHHGIYAGNGRVIHYAGLNRAFRRGPVEEVSLERFTRGRGLEVAANAAPRFAGEAVVERARRRLGEDRYSVWSNNCEHFAQWCSSGVAHSAQVQRWAVRAQRCIDAVTFRQLARASTTAMPAPGSAAA